MRDSTPTIPLPTGPDRRGAIIDILIFVTAGLAFYGLEKLLSSRGWLPIPEVASGAVALIAGFVVALVLVRRRGQSLADIGLRRVRRWWHVPVWGLVTIVAVIASQLLLQPLAVGVFGLEPPDLSKYDAIHGNLTLLLLTAAGAMVTGGFMEEVVYRGLMIDRLRRIIGDSRRGLIAAALLNGLPFGLVHFEWGIGGIVVTTLMGSVIGGMYLVTRGNLWPLIAGHAAMDAIMLTQVYFMGTGVE